MQNRRSDRIIPEVRYHPTIQTRTAPPQTRTRPPQTRTRVQVDPGPAGAQKQTRDVKKAVRKPGSGPDPPQNQNQDRNQDQELNQDQNPDRNQDQGQKLDRNQNPEQVQNQNQEQDRNQDRNPNQDQVQDQDQDQDQDLDLVLGVQMDQKMVEEVEVLTRGQRTNPEWFRWRKNRITASIAHKIANSRFANGKSQTPPRSYLAAITGEAQRVETRAMAWGIKMEAEALRQYEEVKQSSLGRGVCVEACGAFVCVRRPWLSGSPDGVLTDRRTGRRLLCVEVKCPFNQRQHSLEQACRDPRFCLSLEQAGGVPVYRLKLSHPYFTQLQVQMAVTGLRQADFVVFTLKEMAVVPVTFDPAHWEVTVNKMEAFYYNAVVPYIRKKKQEETARLTPEL